MTTILALTPYDTETTYPDHIQAAIATEMAGHGYTVEWMDDSEVGTYRTLAAATMPDTRILTYRTLDDTASEVLCAAVEHAWEA